MRVVRERRKKELTNAVNETGLQDATESCESTGLNRQGLGESEVVVPGLGLDREKRKPGGFKREGSDTRPFYYRVLLSFGGFYVN